MSPRALLFALAAAVTLTVVGPAAAQMPPLPFFGDDGGQSPKKSDEKSKENSGDDKKSGEEIVDDAPREYKLPEKKALPEGPARVLGGAVVTVAFKGIVNPGMGEFVASAIQRAEREKAQAVLIELDTPGGLVSTTQTMVQVIMASKVPVIVYVTPSGAHAASAGTFITLAGHVAAMAPATRLGAAHPVTGGGKDPEAEGGVHMGRKVENDLVAFVEGIARERNRNVEWAIDAVKRSVSITADRALELGVIDLVARDRAELFEKLEGKQLMIGTEKVELRTKGVATVTHDLSMREWIVNLLANPGVAMILGILGLIGIMVEIYHPGMIAPGVLGVLCIICSLIAVEQLPIDLGAAILVVAGIGLLIAEIYAPTYGALGILGGIGLTIGLLLLVDTNEPGYLVDPSLKLDLADVLPVVLLVLAFVAYLSFFVVTRKRGRSVTGSEGLVGAVGTVLKPIGPDGGTVFVAGEYWRARAAETIPEKEQVEVVKVDGLLVEVRRRPR